MQNNVKEKGTWRSNGVTNSPASLGQDVLLCRELSQAGETGSVCPHLLLLSRPGLPARTRTKAVGLGKEGSCRRRRMRRSRGCALR